MSERRPIIAQWTAFRCPADHLYAVAQRDVFAGDATDPSAFEFAPSQSRVEMKCHCGANVWSLMRLAVCPEDRARMDAYVAAGGA